MKSLLAPILHLRTTRVAALFLSVSAIAMGGFFISHVKADSGNHITITSPSSSAYVRGTTTIGWTDDATTTPANPFLLQYSTNSFFSAGNTITTSGTANLIGNSYSGAYDWNTTSSPHVDDGSYKVRITDAPQNFGTTASFSVDNTAPTTTLATSIPPNGNNGWYKTAPTITLTCTDPTVNSISSGCSSINYAWYNATSSALVVASTTTTGAVTAPEGDNILVYSSQDNAVDKDGIHNIETAHSQEFKVDTIAPTISSYTLNGLAANAYFNPANASTTVVITASEPVNWLSARIRSVTSPSTIYRDFSPSSDGQATTTLLWHGNLSTGSLADGAYEITYHIKDTAGNETGTVAGGPALTPYQIVVDTTVPTITLTAPVADHVYKGTSSGTTNDATALSFTSSDTNPLTYTYAIDGASTTTPLTAPHDGTTALTSALSGLSDGRHTIVVTVTDGAGNSASSSPVSFVFDSNNRLTVSGTSTDHADFATIGSAIVAATVGDTIDIFPGTYTEDVAVNKSLTLQSHLGAVGTTIIHGLVTVTADNSTVQNLSFTNPGASMALIVSGASHVFVTGNTFAGVGTTLTSGSAQAIDVNGGSSSAMSDITISGNTITNVGSVNLAYDSSVSGTSAKGIYIGDSTGVNTILGVTISGNHISNITASPTLWVKTGGVWTSKIGRGAYGILVNHATSGTGSTSVTITGNTINTLNGLWAHAIGLEGNTPGAQVTGNIISGLVDHKNGTDDVGVMLQDNTGSGSITIAKNQFAQNIIGVGADSSITATSTAVGNWWGSIQGPTTLTGYSYVNNPFGNGAAVSNFVTFVPWCTEATCSTLDSSAPTATLTDTPAPLTNAIVISITVGTTGDTAYYSYQLDGGAWSAETPVSTAIASSSLVDGSHTLNVLGRDQAGNWQTTPTTYSWTIDTVPPIIAQVRPVTTPTATTTPSYVFSTTKLGTITYAGGCNSALASTATTTGNVAITFDHLSDGLYGACTITVTDSAGNASNVLAVSQFRIDTTPPVVDAGSNKNVNVPVAQHAVVTDTNGSGVVTYGWAQQSGPGTVTFSPGNAADTTLSANTDGVYTLRLLATDAAGNVGHGDMTFTWDKTAPTITAPANITKEATAHLTPLTLTPATATDAIDPTPVVTNNAPAGFPVGVTTVIWTATDAAGNSATATQTVTITDTTKPVIATHSDMTVEATSASGATVTYTAPVATDIVDGTDSVSCLPASGTTFALGDTPVKCDATDHAGNHAVQTSFVVHVVDTTPPVIATHDNLTVTADQLGGKQVSYTAPLAHDAVDGDISAVCTPAPGSLFPVNETTTVTCTKTDAHNNTATPSSFTITVVPDALVQIGISASPTSLTTAATSTVTVAAQDQFGNTITTDSSTKVVLSTDGSGSLGDTILTVVNGVKTTTLTSSSPGVVHVNAASGLLIPNVVAVTFTGVAVPDTTAPVITNVQSLNIAKSSVTVTWTTNELSSSQVEYGTTSGYGASTPIDGALTTAHSVVLTGLTPNTPYHFRVKSADAAMNLATSGDNTFTTVVDDTSAVLAVTGIDGTKTYATADNTFGNGFRWVFHVTVPTNETKFSMKFSDFVSGANVIPANNLRFYSAQSSDAMASTSAMTITAPNTYSSPITLSSDLSPIAAGRQIEVTVEMKVPTGTLGGSYSASYGIMSTSTPIILN